MAIPAAAAEQGAGEDGSPSPVTSPALGETLDALPREVSVDLPDPIASEASLRVLDAEGEGVPLGPVGVDTASGVMRAEVSDPVRVEGDFVLAWSAEVAGAADPPTSGDRLEGGVVFSVSPSGQQVVEANASIDPPGTDRDRDLDPVRVAGGIVFGLGALVLVVSVFPSRFRGATLQRWALPLAGGCMVLGVGALVVGALEADDDTASPLEVRAEGDGVVDLTVTPGSAGVNEVHVYVFGPEGQAVDVDALTLALTQREGDLVDVAVPVFRAGPGHFLTYQAPLLYPGTYDLAVDATTVDGAAAGAVATVEVP